MINGFTNPIASRTDFTDFLSGWLWEALKDFFVQFRAHPVLGWLYDVIIRAMVYWQTFWYVLSFLTSKPNSKDGGE